MALLRFAEIFSPCGHQQSSPGQTKITYSRDMPTHLIFGPRTVDGTLMSVTVFVLPNLKLFVHTEADVIFAASESHWRLTQASDHSTAGNGRPGAVRGDQLQFPAQLVCYVLCESGSNVWRRTQAATEDDCLLELAFTFRCNGHYLHGWQASLLWRFCSSAF